MGYEYDVKAWVSVDGGYTYVIVYQGDSLIRAIRAMLKAKKTSGCVRLEWR